MIKILLKNIAKQTICKDTFDELNTLKNIININFIKMKKFQYNCFYCNDLDFVYYYNPNGSALYLKHDTIANLIKNLFIIEKTDKISSFDITKTNSIAASKSKSQKRYFDTIFSFGENYYNGTNTKENHTIESCLRHIRNSEGNVLKIRCYCWNNKIELFNTGGSHHFAALVYLINTKKIKLNLDCKFILIKLNEKVINTLNKNYYMFITHRKNSEEIFKFFQNKSVMIVKELSYDKNIILFKKDNTKIKSIINLLNIIDDNYIINFNNTLLDLLQNQKNNIENNFF